MQRGPRERIIGANMPRTRVDLFEEAGFGWFRVIDADWFDLATGKLNMETFRALRDAWRPYLETGAKMALVAPFPSRVPGHEPGSPSYFRAWQEACRIAAAEVGDIVRLWQIGNEPNLWLFRRPLDLEQAAEFAFSAAEGLWMGDPTAFVGINPCCRDDDMRRTYELTYGPTARVKLDYVGIDLYPGSYNPGSPDSYGDVIAELDRLIPDDRPIVFMEFGYPSKGGRKTLDPATVTDFARSLGYRQIEDIRTDPTAFLAAIPAPLRGSLDGVPAHAFRDEVLDIAQHVFKRWLFTWPEHAHDEADQARFYERALTILLEHPRVLGLFVFSWTDHPLGDPFCWRCEATDCPIETGHGILYGDETPKPAFQVFKDTIARYTASAT